MNQQNQESWHPSTGAGLAVSVTILEGPASRFLDAAGSLAWLEIAVLLTQNLSVSTADARSHKKTSRCCNTVTAFAVGPRPRRS